MRKVLITGGTGNIGSRLVVDLIKDGHSVYFTTRSKKSGERFLFEKGLDEKQCKAIELDFDVTDAISKCMEQLEELPDAIIHNARSLDTLKTNNDGRVDTAQFQREFFNGISFPYALTNAILDMKAPLKDVLFISSMYGTVAPTPSLYEDFKRQSPVNYGVVKAAQIHLVKELAIRLAPDHIRVNAISYGGVEGRTDETFKKRYSELAPSGRMLNHEDLYPPVKYFLSNPDLNVTGENLKVDGGWTIW